MGRLIQTDSTSKLRTTLSRSIVLALRELMVQSSDKPTQSSLDLAAYIALSLEQIDQSIDATVVAWEKRGYWVKADRFRMDWMWCNKLGSKLRQAVLKNDWAGITEVVVQVGQKMVSVKVPQRNKIGTPWVGAYEHLVKSTKP